MIQWLKDWFRTGQLGGRSSQWPKVRREFLEMNPACAVCDTRKNLIVHHKKPYHKFPDLELSLSNLITLCESAGMNCHITFGHLGNYRSWNEDVDEDVKIWYNKVTLRI